MILVETRRVRLILVTAGVLAALSACVVVVWAGGGRLERIPATQDAPPGSHGIGAVGAYVEIKLRPSDGRAGANFGVSIAADADVCIVGAHGADGYEPSSGAAYVFRLSNGSWVEEAKLSGSNLTSGAEFGASVAIHANLAVVGAPRLDSGAEDTGAAYVFRFTGGSWIEEAVLTAGGARGALFGTSVSVTDKPEPYVLVGAPGMGAAYLFRLEGTMWSQVAKWTSSDGSASRMGTSVSIHGGTAVVGAPLDDDYGARSGSAYLYALQGGAWIEKAKLLASDAVSPGEFGFSVAAAEGVILVGADLQSWFGAAYVFRLDGGTWLEEAKLTPQDPEFLQQFGVSLWTDGAWAVIGAVGDADFGSYSGSAYVFHCSDHGSWSQIIKLTASDAEGEDWFGQSVAGIGRTVLVGAAGDDDQGSASGSVYMFMPDCNDNGISDREEPDNDGDGVIDDCDNCPDDSNARQEDADGDTVGDACDPCTDTDGDGLGNPGYPPNTCPTDECPSDAANDQDRDGVCGDVDNCEGVFNPKQGDADGDGIGDACDRCPGDPQDDVDVDNWCADIDNCPQIYNPDQADGDDDGVGDVCDACPLDPQNDVDRDGICGDVDNCPAVSNRNQTDSDGDGLGDACDPDRDGDDVANIADNCPDIPNPDQGDEDADGKGDVCDVCPLDPQDDGDRDGVCGDVDNCPTISNASQTDSDADGVGNSCDNCRFDANPIQTDTDGDAVGDACDNCQDQPNPGQEDIDADAVGDICDNCPSVPNEGQEDDDEDWAGDACDDCPSHYDPLQLDCDRDGIGDVCAMADCPPDVPACDDCNQNMVPDGCDLLDREIAQMLNDDGDMHDRFATSVAASGRHVLVGAPYDASGGSVFVFWRAFNWWTLQAILTASDADPTGGFGGAVALAPDMAVVGDYWEHNGRGAAYVYRCADGHWRETVKLTGHGQGSYQENFGYAVAVGPHWVFVGSPYERPTNQVMSGCVYIFAGSGDTWSQHSVIVGGDAASVDEFGFAIALDGNTVVVGAPQVSEYSSKPGAAYVFRFNGAEWVEEAKLSPSDGADDDAFGISVGIQSGVVVVGAEDDDDNGWGSGSAYVFRRVGAAWVQEAKLTPDDGSAADHFGNSVSISRDVVIVGAYRDDPISTQSGSAYVFRLRGSRWLQTAKLTPHDGGYSHQFGFSVAMPDDTTAYIGSRNDSDHGLFGGAVYAYAVASRDCQSDGVPDECHMGDVDGDDAIDLYDYYRLRRCLRGPSTPYTLGGCCHVVDFDTEWHIDLRDAAAFQRAFTGP